MSSKIEIMIVIIVTVCLSFIFGFRLSHNNNENLINQLEKEKFEYCEVIAKLEWYAPDSVKYPYRNIIKFAKLQEFNKCKN